MTSSRQHLTDRLVDLLERMFIEMHHCVPEEWSDTESTIPQLKTLALLHQSPARMGAIAEFLRTSLPSATSMVDRLVDRELVERVADPQDRRVVACQLTPKGREEVERFWQIKRMTLIKLADHMSTEELETVVEATEILGRASRSVHEELAGETSLDRAVGTAGQSHSIEMGFSAFEKTLSAVESIPTQHRYINWFLTLWTIPGRMRFPW